LEHGCSITTTSRTPVPSKKESGAQKPKYYKKSNTNPHYFGHMPKNVSSNGGKLFMELDLRVVLIWKNPPFFKIIDDFLQQACHPPSRNLWQQLIRETCFVVSTALLIYS
jgi:hypothetical protein